MTSTDTTPAGYILIAGDYIQATGATPEAAIAEYVDAVRPLSDDDEQRPLAVEDFDAADLLRADSRNSRAFCLRAATRRLLDHVETAGGDTSWTEVDGVCDTDAE